MKRIQVGGHRGGKKSWSRVDDEDYERVNAFSWSLSHKGYARSQVTENGVTRRFGMSRMILGFPSKDMYADHIDGDRLNNQRYNLRVVTPRQNAQNRFQHRANPISLGTQKMKDGKFQATINLNGKAKYLGVYVTQLEAHEVYLRFVQSITHQTL